MHYCKECKKTFLIKNGSCGKCNAALEKFPMEPARERAVWIRYGVQISTILVCAIILAVNYYTELLDPLVAPISVVIMAGYGVISNWQTSRIFREEMERLKGRKIEK